MLSLSRMASDAVGTRWHLCRANGVFRHFFVQAYGMGRTPGRMKKLSSKAQVGEPLTARLSPRGQGVPSEPLTARQNPSVQGGHELAIAGPCPTGQSNPDNQLA
jgi:hypothetical protein